MLEVWFNPERSGQLYLVSIEGTLIQAQNIRTQTISIVTCTGFSKLGNNTLFIKKKKWGGVNKIYQLRKVSAWTQSMHTCIYHTFRISLPPPPQINLLKDTDHHVRGI